MSCGILTNTLDVCDLTGTEKERIVNVHAMCSMGARELMLCNRGWVMTVVREK